MKQKNEFDDYRKTYKQAVNKSISFSGLDIEFFVKVKADKLLEILHSRLDNASSASILDVGCGIGTYHPLLKNGVGKIAGIDLSEECLQEARLNNSDVDYRHYDGVRMPFSDDVFDASFAICVMHHVPPAMWEAFAREMVRVTRPGGVVTIFEHNPYNPLTRRAVNTCPFDADAVLLSKNRTRTLLKEAGLSQLEARYILTVPPMNGLLTWIDDRFGHVPFGAQYYVCGRV